MSERVGLLPAKREMDKRLQNGWASGLSAAEESERGLALFPTLDAYFF